MALKRGGVLFQRPIHLVWREGAQAAIKYADQTVIINNAHLVKAAEQAIEDQQLTDNSAVHRLGN